MMQPDTLPENDDEWVDVEPSDDMWQQYASETGLDFPERNVAQQLNVYIPPILLMLGTVGNILTAIVLWKFVQKVLSTCLYVFVSQIVDIVVLYLLCGNDWLATLANLDVRKIAMLSNPSVCKIYPFVTDLVLHLTTYMMVAMSIETTLVLVRPQRLMRLCRMERARAVILLILVLLICVNAHSFWTYDKTDPDKAHPGMKPACSMMRQGNNQQNDDFRKYVWPLLEFLVLDFFPYFTIFACTVTQITVRVRRKDHLRQLENTWKAYSVDSSAARELQLAFLALCLSHLFLLLPKMACDMFNYLVQPTMVFLVSYSFKLDSKRILAERLGNLLLYIYLSNKFFVLLGCCQAFRTEIWSLLTCFTCKSNRHVTQRRQQLPLATQQPLLNRANHEPPQGNCISPSPRKAFSMTSV